MFNRFFSFYSLAACVAAAVSQSKKAVSAAAAVVVGIGLLTAPIDSAQAQTGMPKVTHLYLFASQSAPYVFTYAWVGATAYLDTSSAYFKWDDVNETLFNLPGNPQYPDGYIRNGYFVLAITPRSQEGLGDFIDVFFYVGLDGSMSAWVEDSEGNEYTVDVTMVY